MDSNQSNGGIARAEALTPERKTEIGRKGAEARWSATIPNVLCEGNLNLGVVAIPCYVTEDGERLISGRGMQEALRLVDEDVPESGQKPGSRMTRLLTNKKLKPLIFQDKSPDHFLPKKVRWQGRVINGHNAEMLADICEGMLEARKKLPEALTARQRVVADQCEILLRAFAKVGITALIDEATGYQKLRPIDGLRNYFDVILKRDLAAWFQRFPDEYYENIYKLKDWPWQGMSKNRYSVVSHYTNDLYERMMPGITEEFDRRNPKNSKGQRKVKNQQLLNDEVGDKLFSQHMHTVMLLQRACLNKGGNKWAAFMRLMNEVLPRRGQSMPLPFPKNDAPSD